MLFSIMIASLVIRQLMTADDAGATTGSDLIQMNVCQAQLLYMGSFVNYNRYHIGDYFTNYTSMGLEDVLSSGSLHGPLSTIKTDGQASDPVPFLSHVPQGSVLGPVLFLISINDLPDNIRSDGDCVLCRNINSLVDLQILQDDQNSLAQCETDWHMKFNVSRRRRPHSFSLIDNLL